MEKVFAGRYKIGRRLGSGAMGAVYEALDLATQRKRALKIMHGHLLERPDLRERFALEARITAPIRCPFIVDVLDAGVDEIGTPYLTMELLHGEDMSRLLRRKGPLSPTEALPFLVQVAIALDETHRAGIVHRDLKPGNLFVEERSAEPPRLKVLDFGVAKVFAETLDHGTAAAGTPVYMAPEQLRGGQVRPTTDIFALGMLTFTFLTGRAYWEDERATLPDMIAFALVTVEGPKEAATVRAARCGVILPRAFDPWFEQIVARDPRDRFQQATTAIRALFEVFGVDIGLPEEVETSSPFPSRSAPDPESSTMTADSSNPKVDSPTADLPHIHSFQPTTVTVVQPTKSPLEVQSSPVPPQAPAEFTQASPRESTQAPPRESTQTPPRESTQAASPPKRRSFLPLTFALGFLALGAVVGLLVVPTSSTTTAPLLPPSSLTSDTESPLAPPSSVLACPLFSASGVEEPSGWLGAAAASTFCERAHIVLGGIASRTLAPAELLAFPTTPAEKMPEDPYSDSESRERTLTSARARSAIFADGKVVRSHQGFRVDITLRYPHGGEFRRASGSGRALYEAVRAAMNLLVESGGLPMASSLDPRVADFLGAKNIPAALLLHDLTFALAQNAGSVQTECAHVEAAHADFPELAPGEKFRCAYTLGLATQAVNVPRADSTSMGALAARARVLLMTRKESDIAVAAELSRQIVTESTPLGRSVLAATASCLYQATNPERARELALLSIQADPRNTAGEWCAPWIQAGVVTQGTTSAAAVLRAQRAWAPWDAYGFAYAVPLQTDPSFALSFARRAYTLSPFDTFIARTLADQLLSAGAREEARGIALAVGTGGYPVHKLESELLLLRADASQARFGTALSRAQKAMVPSPGDAGWVLVQRLEIAWRALQIALIVGRGAQIADLAVKLFLDPEPSPLDGASMDIPLRIPAICAHTSRSVAGRCFARFDTLRERLSLGALPETTTFRTGAERYAHGDLTGAAAAFRGLIRDPGPYMTVLGDEMIETFESFGDKNIVERLEAAHQKTDHELGGASLKTVRAARRAAKLGNQAEAARLAEQVIVAWSTADVKVPAVAEMLRLQKKNVH